MQCDVVGRSVFSMGVCSNFPEFPGACQSLNECLGGFRRDAFAPMLGVDAVVAFHDAFLIRRIAAGSDILVGFSFYDCVGMNRIR